jgi:mono/diheme cytochrome c family protein
MSASDGDASAGKALFSEKCGACHVLADAETKGAVGPNLDDAFGSARQQGFDESTMRDVVRGQIAYPEEPMPAQLYEGDDAEDVAAYVAKCAGVPACGVQASGAEAAGGGATTGTSTAPAQTAPSDTTSTTETGGGGAAGGTEPAGKAVFAQNCGGCHTLKDAGTNGQVGPNLDALKPAKDRVKTQVENGGGGMPAFKGQLSDEEIDAVADYVSTNAGK